MHKMTIRMKDHPRYAVDCAVAHIIHHSEYRVVKNLQEQELYHAANHGSEGPVVPEGVTASQIHVEVFILGHEWKIHNLKILARNEILKALGLTDQPTCKQFKKLLLDTGIFSEKFCKAPTYRDHLVNEVLSALGTYGAMQHEQWMAQDYYEYMELLEYSGPYFSMYLLNAQAQHTAFLRELPRDAKRLKSSSNNNDDVSMANHHYVYTAKTSDGRGGSGCDNQQG